MTRKTRKITKNKRLIPILVIIAIASVFLTVIEPRTASAVSGKAELSLFLETANVQVDTHINSGKFRQIHYKYKGEDIAVTDLSRPSTDPQTDGEYIVWMSKIGPTWQVFMHHITTGETIQLTSSGNNVYPTVSGNNVAWEGQVDGIWQIFVFDGVKVTQVTDNSTPSEDAEIQGDSVLFSTKNPDDLGWNIFLYNIQTQELVDLVPESYGKTPKFGAGLITWTTLINKEPQTFEYIFDEAEFLASIYPNDGFVAGITDESTESTETTSTTNQEESTIELIQVSADDIRGELGLLEELVGESDQSVESSESTDSANSP